MGKRKSYQPWTQDQIFLMPPSMKEWLREDDLAWFILDVVGELDILPIEDAFRRKDARGRKALRTKVVKRRAQADGAQA